MQNIMVLGGGGKGMWKNLKSVTCSLVYTYFISWKWYLNIKVSDLSLFKNLPHIIYDMLRVGLFSLDDHLKLCHFYGSLFKCEPCDQTFGGLQVFEQ